MKIFLVTGDVTVSHYMEEENSTTKNQIRIVYADDSESAEEKFTSFFTDKSRPQDVTYSVTHVIVTDPII